MNFIFFIITSCFLWSTDLFLREPLNGNIETFDLLIYEYGIAIIFLAPWILGNSIREFRKIKKKHLLGLLFIGILGSSVGSFFLTQSLFQVGLESYSFFQFIQPLFVAILAAKFLREKFDWKNFLWFFAVMLTGVLMNYPDIVNGVLIENILQNPFGILAAILATLIWGACTIIGKRLLKTYSPLFLAFMRWLVAFCGACLLITWKGFPNIEALTMKSSISILFLSLVSGFFAMVLYYKGLKYLKATSVAYLELLYPVFSIGLGGLVLYREQHIYQIIGLISLTALIGFKVLTSEKEFFRKFRLKRMKS